MTFNYKITDNIHRHTIFFFIVLQLASHSRLLCLGVFSTIKSFYYVLQLE